MEPPKTVMIDTTAAGQLKEEQEKKALDIKEKTEAKRSASLKLVLMLVGTMRVVSKQFRVHLLKGMLLQDEYFKTKGTSVISK